MQSKQNRWAIAGNCTLLMVCLGTVYAWSFFQKLLTDSYGWSNSQVAWVFSLAVCFLGLAAAAGGALLPKLGPTRLAVTPSSTAVIPATSSAPSTVTGVFPPLRN